MANNQLGGHIPEMSGNRLDGIIPDSLGNLINLDYLYFSINAAR